MSDFNLDKMYCGIIRRGGIFVFEDDKVKKEKAIVILQDNVLNEGLPTVVGALIEPYKKGEEIFPNEVLLKASETGLGKDGICMLHKIYTIERPRIIVKKGELKIEKIKEIFKALDINFGRFRD